MDHPKVLIFGDIAVPTGFGRIGMAVAKYLVSKGYWVHGADIQYDGLLPWGTPLIMFNGQPVWISPLNGRDHGQTISAIAGAFQPDLVLSLQDFPYHEMLHHATSIDWSVTAHVGITPVDGIPVYDRWTDLVPRLDGFMTISEFGVKAFKDAGIHADLCPPGVDTGEFFRLSDAARVELRAKLGIPTDAFVVGMMAMNQGRKDFGAMVQGFADAFRDIPAAYLYLDCEKISPAGWDIPKMLVSQSNLNPSRVLYREDAIRAGVLALNERYNLLDVHAVISHREGYGLPHNEAAATGCPTMAIDYCSGREVAGENGERGGLVKCEPSRISTWGGARDYNADIADLAAQLVFLYEHPAERRARGERALEWAKTRTWDKASEAVEHVIHAALDNRAADIAKKYAQPVQPVAQTAVQSMPAGVTTVYNINAPIQVYANNPGEVAMGIAQAVGQQVEQPMALLESDNGSDGTQ